jgi:hypothetical protein
VRLPSQKNKKKEGSEGKREGRREGEKGGRERGRGGREGGRKEEHYYGCVSQYNDKRFNRQARQIRATWNMYM